MSDDLQNRLRERAKRHLAQTPADLLDEAADRIDDLENRYQMATILMRIDAKEIKDLKSEIAENMDLLLDCEKTIIALKSKVKSLGLDVLAAQGQADSWPVTV